MKVRILCGVISVAVLVVCMLLVRHCLLKLGLPDGAMLETLAQELRSREVSPGEAVAAFCREMIDYGSP